ncbi:MAG: putative signal transducing protein [Actinomycetota bacterium]
MRPGAPGDVKGDTVVAEFADRWDAGLARHYLEDAGIEARLEEAGSHLTGEGSRLILIVAGPDADEARELLAEMEAGGQEELIDRRPWWVPAVALLVVVGLIWAAVPSFLWPWILLIGLIGFLLWRAAGPRTPRA